MQIESATDPGAHGFTGSIRGVFQGSQTKSRLVSSNQREQRSGKVLISGHAGKTLGGEGDCLSQGL